jgi:hypothetical protein
MDGEEPKKKRVKHVWAGLDGKGGGAKGKKKKNSPDERLLLIHVLRDKVCLPFSNRPPRKIQIEPSRLRF